jgi:hypothetical protein
MVLEISMIPAMTTPRLNSHKVLLLTSDRPASTGGQSPSIRRYRLARLRVEGRQSGLRSQIEATGRLSD